MNVGRYWKFGVFVADSGRREPLVLYGTKPQIKAACNFTDEMMASLKPVHPDERPEVDLYCGSWKASGDRHYKRRKVSA